MRKNNEFLVVVMVGSLILIIVSLTFVLLNEGITLFPQWLIEALILGFFTLSGAGAGAFLAGRYTLKSVNKQIEQSEREAERIRLVNNNNALRIINYVLEDFYAIYGFASSPFHGGITDTEILKRGINEFNDPIKKIENVISDTELLSKISDEYITLIPGNIRREVSHLKNIVRVVNLNSHNYDDQRVRSIYVELTKIFDRFNEVTKNIERIVEEKLSN